MLHCYLTTEMSRIFLHQPSLRKLKGLLHIQSYSTNWNNKPKKKENKPQNYPCFRDSSHVLCHATVWKGFLSTFLPMQGPTTQRQSKAQPEFTQPSSHVLHLLLLLSPPGWDKIDRWTFLKPLLEGKHLSCTCNELRTKQEWHPAQLLNYHSVK